MSILLKGRGSIAPNLQLIDALVLQVGRLVRHRGSVRERVVSAMLLRYLPVDAGYAWNGEAALRARLALAALDATTIEHLIASAQLEITTIRQRRLE